MLPTRIHLANASFMIAAVLAATGSIAASQENSAFTAGETVFVNQQVTELKVGYQTLRVLQPGTPVEVISTQDDWVQVAVTTDGDEVRGWVRMASVSRKKPTRGEDGTKETGEESPDVRGQENAGTSETSGSTASGDKGVKPTLADKFQQMLAKKEAAENDSTPTDDPEIVTPVASTANPDVSQQGEPSGDGQPGQTPQAKSGKKENASTAETPAAKPKSETEAVTPPKESETGSEQDETQKTEAKDVAAKKEESGEDIGEGPEELAKQFEKILAELRSQRKTNEPAKTEPEAKEISPPAAADDSAATESKEASREPTRGVLVLRLADDLVDVPKDERFAQLILSGDQFTNRALRELEGLSAEMLSIEAVNVSNAGIQHVAKVRGVRQLRLWSPGITDGALNLIAEMSDLELLDIEGTAIEGQAFAELQQLPRLQKIILDPKVSDATLAGLSQLPALRRLDLRACGKLSLDCLDAIAEMKDLEIVWLPRHLRAKGKKALKLTLPECQVRS